MLCLLLSTFLSSGEYPTQQAFPSIIYIIIIKNVLSGQAVTAFDPTSGGQISEFKTSLATQRHPGLAEKKNKTVFLLPQV